METIVSLARAARQGKRAARKESALALDHALAAMKLEPDRGRLVALAALIG